MWRAILAVLAGLVAWVAVASVLNVGLRWWLPGYLAAEPAMAFTLAMQIARLSIGVAASLAAGALARAIAPSVWWPPLIIGVIGLAVFVPGHIRIWDKFPIWYHLTFLVTLLPLVMLGASFVSRRRTAPA